VHTTRDIDVAKDRLVDSLTSARDVAVSAVRDDIAPAVAAAVDAALDASGPMYAEAASRAGDAVSALRGSDAAKAISESSAAKAISGRRRTKRRRWPIVAAIVAVGVGAAAIAKRRAAEPTLVDVTDAPAEELSPRSSL
jgi:hypothetical protein